MPVCRACFDPRRNEIDQQIVCGVPLRVIAASTGLSLGGLSRHRAHVANLIKELRGDERAEHASTLYKGAESLLDEAKEILSTAKSEKNFTAATAAINAATRLVELLMRASGELQSTPGGIHLTQTIRVTTNYTTAAIDAELASLIAEATDNFSPERIEELKRIACNARAIPLLSDTNQTA